MLTISLKRQSVYTHICIIWGCMANISIAWCKTEVTHHTNCQPDGRFPLISCWMIFFCCCCCCCHYFSGRSQWSTLAAWNVITMSNAHQRKYQLNSIQKKCRKSQLEKAEVWKLLQKTSTGVFDHSKKIACCFQLKLFKFLTWTIRYQECLC